MHSQAGGSIRQAIRCLAWCAAPARLALGSDTMQACVHSMVTSVVRWCCFQSHPRMQSSCCAWGPGQLLGGWLVGTVTHVWLQSHSTVCSQQLCALSSCNQATTESQRGQTANNIISLGERALALHFRLSYSDFDLSSSRNTRMQASFYQATQTHQTAAASPSEGWKL